MRRLLSLIATFALPLSACGVAGAASNPSGGGRPLSAAPVDGIATFYDADGSGNCSYDKSPGDLDVTALALPIYDESAACGACLLVTGPKGEVTVRVVDSCPGCENSGVDLDLSAQAFAKIAEPKDGRISISFRHVSCATSGNLAYRFKEGSSKWWTAIQVRNHRVPIAKLEYRKGDAWVTMERASYNYFVESSGVGDQPNGLGLRVTATDGQIIEDVLASGVQDGRTMEGSQQFD